SARYKQSGKERADGKKGGGSMTRGQARAVQGAAVNDSRPAGRGVRTRRAALAGLAGLAGAAAATVLVACGSAGGTASGGGHPAAGKPVVTARHLTRLGTVPVRGPRKTLYPPEQGTHGPNPGTAR